MRLTLDWIEKQVVLLNIGLHKCMLYMSKTALYFTKKLNPKTFRHDDSHHQLSAMMNLQSDVSEPKENIMTEKINCKTGSDAAILNLLQVLPIIRFSHGLLLHRFTDSSLICRQYMIHY